MSLLRYQPKNLLAQFHDEIGQLFDQRLNPSAEWLPAVDVQENAKEYIIHVDLPGVKSEDIDITLENGLLALKGSRNWDETTEEKNYKRVERARGTFYRQFALPDTADADAVTAKFDQGVLEVTVPKQEKVLPRKIKVT